MGIEFPVFEAERIESLSPNEQKAGAIYSRLGYKFADAIADLVDNSVDASASNVLIRFIRDSRGIHRVIIVDDGGGMRESELREAMRFGSEMKNGKKRLGKYGIGLKSASLSQAETVSVLSRSGSSVAGRRWTVQNIKKNWSCEILAGEGVRRAFLASYGDVDVARSGTIVIWERLEHLRALPAHVDRVLQKTMDDVSIELGIRFHRFLERESLAIAFDQHFIGDEPPEVRRYVKPLNPFDYPESGHRDYPAIFRLSVEGVRCDVKCHVWPPRSAAVGYRLGGGKVALRQGFYFYRNDRIIQAGGWNGLRADDGEPHLSLARVEVDVPPKLDSLFKLDVTKSHLDPPPHFFQALDGARVKGVTWSGYIDHAQSVYRKRKVKAAAKFPFVPGPGVSSSARKAIAAILNETGTGRSRAVRFKWAPLDHDEIVQVDPEKTTIVLNSRFKKELVEGGGRDAPVLKMALMFLLQRELDKAFKTKSGDAWLQRINHALIASLKGR